MHRARRPHFNESQLQSIEDVQTVLELIDHDMPLYGLDSVRLFNYTYLIITRRVRQALKAHKFEHPDFLERFDRRFAYYYLHALQQYLVGAEAPLAWKLAFDSARRRGITSLAAISLGVNAHVNHDIPLVLRDLQADGRQLRDYRYVNAIISQALGEVLQTLPAESGRLRWQRQIARPFYKTAMNVLIRLWRKQAWQHYLKLEQGTYAQRRLESLAAQYATFLQRLPI